MANVVARYENGPLTFECSTAVDGGQLVVHTSGGKIGPAGALATNPLGVALYKTVPAGTSNVATTSYGETVVDVSMPQPEVAVAFKGVFKMKNTHASTALVLGDYVECGPTGGVQKVSTGKVVGQVVEPGGIAAGAKGLIRLSL